MVALWVPRIGPAWVKMAIFKGYIFVSCGCKFFLAYLTHTWPTWAPTGTPSLLVGVNRERTSLILGQFQKFQRQITYLVNFEYFLTNWTCSVLGVEQTNSTCMGSGMCASLGTLVPPSSAGIFSALSSFVAETPTMFHMKNLKKKF